jgi:AraC family transcriptional regulator
VTATTEAELVAEHEAAVGRAITAMRESLYQAVRLNDHAAAGLYSRYHFHRVFRRVTGTTPARYLAGLRMQRAKYLLAATDHRVTAISGMVGYESLGTFTTQFGRLVGVSPGRFRQLVDRCGSGRLGDLRLPQHGTPVELCARSAPADSPDWTTFVGLFAENQLCGTSPSVAVLPLLPPGLLARCRGQDGAGVVLALAVPNHTRLADLAIGCLDGALVNTVGPVGAAVCDDRRTDAVHLHLRPLRPLDPPVVSVAPARLVAATHDRVASRPSDLLA